MGTRILNGLGEMILFLIQVGRQQQFGHPEHAIDRGTDFMAHVGQKLTFRPARLLCGLLLHPFLGRRRLDGIEDILLQLRFHENERLGKSPHLVLVFLRELLDTVLARIQFRKIHLRQFFRIFGEDTQGAGDLGYENGRTRNAEKEDQGHYAQLPCQQFLTGCLNLIHRYDYRKIPVECLEIVDIGSQFLTTGAKRILISKRPVATLVGRLQIIDQQIPGIRIEHIAVIHITDTLGIDQNLPVSSEQECKSRGGDLDFAECLVEHLEDGVHLFSALFFDILEIDGGYQRPFHLLHGHEMGHLLLADPVLGIMPVVDRRIPLFAQLPVVHLLVEQTTLQIPDIFQRGTNLVLFRADQDLPFIIEDEDLDRPHRQPFHPFQGQLLGFCLIEAALFRQLQELLHQ